MLVGLDPDIPNGPQVGHAIVTNTEITEYRIVGIQAGAHDTTIKLSRSSLVAAADTPEVDGQVGVVFSSGAQGIIKNKKVSSNICDHPDCGDDFENQAQGTAIFAADAASGSSISNNVISHNDLGIALALNSGCCEVDRNILKNNRFFGIAVVNSEHTISNTKISGGNVGVIAAAFGVKTVATLDRVIITGVTTPTEELSLGTTAKSCFRTTFRCNYTVGSIVRRSYVHALPIARRQ